MKIEELLSHVTDSVSARMVFAEPVERDGVTVITAAQVVGGGGGGTGVDPRGQGDGGGLGLVIRPVGAYVIKDGRLRWEPAVDVNRLIATIGTVTVTALLVVARILRSRR